jgi:hypothetical protein
MYINKTLACLYCKRVIKKRALSLSLHANPRRETAFYSPSTQKATLCLLSFIALLALFPLSFLQSLFLLISYINFQQSIFKNLLCCQIKETQLIYTVNINPYSFLFPFYLYKTVPSIVFFLVARKHFCKTLIMNFSVF